jgi:hypothetical protein
MMKEVEPLAATRKSVFKDSNTNATTTNVQRAHHPGNTFADNHADASAKIALALVNRTNKVVLLFDGMQKMR